MYAYLLGLYLGDGCISRMPRTYVMRIFLNDGQPDVIAEAARAITELVPMRRVGFDRRGRCVIVRAYWGGWPAMMPQHGRGRKHLRQLVLNPGSKSSSRHIPISSYADASNRTAADTGASSGGKIYPAYAFSNRSRDILGLVAWACRLLEIRYTQPSRISISIARRPDVARLDAIMGRSWREPSEDPVA